MYDTKTQTDGCPAEKAEMTGCRYSTSAGQNRPKSSYYISNNVLTDSYSKHNLQ